jgi:hypothetical protein
MLVDALNGPAVAVLLELEAAGFEVGTAGDRLKVKPISKLTTNQRAELERYRAELLLLLRICDVAVQDRRTVFTQQLGSGVHAGLLLFRAGVPYVAGRCFSCGDPTDRPVHGVCWRCAFARRLALKVPLPVSLAAPYDEARVAS